MISSGSYATSVKFTLAIVTALRGIPMKNAKFLLLPSAFLLASCGAGIPDSSSTMEEASLDSSLPATSPSDVSETPSESPSSEEKSPMRGKQISTLFPMLVSTPRSMIPLRFTCPWISRLFSNGPSREAGKPIA